MTVTRDLSPSSKFGVERRELVWGAELDPDCLSQIVSRVARESGLAVGQVRELKSIPGSQHWHLRRAKEPGVLEVTLVSRSQSGSVDVHANRNAEWIEAVLESFVLGLNELTLEAHECGH